MRRTRKVKILATLGPASSEKAVIARLFSAGADLFRINMSHTDHDMLRRLVTTIREVEAENTRPIGILVDLQGPKLRIGVFADRTIGLAPGQTFTLDSDPTPGNTNRVELHRLLLDDGKVRLRVVSCDAKRAVTKVEIGTALSNRKGVSVPDTTISFSALTPKDRADLEAGLAAGADWIALSFIQRPEDLTEVREIARGRAGILAKIEKPQAVQHLGAIIDQADALMVARGDLGVEMPLEKVPGIQKQITRAARRAGKPVVVATQMLESMIAAPTPTRAEVSDVATAVFEGADAIMLSAESPYYVQILRAQRTDPEPTGADAISAAARQIAETLNLAAICSYTASGTTAMRAARERPQTPVIALSPVVGTARRLSLVWGLHCIYGPEPLDIDGMVLRACDIARDEGFAVPGEGIIITAGTPLGTPGATNMLRIARIAGEDG